MEGSLEGVSRGGLYFQFRLVWIYQWFFSYLILVHTPPFQLNFITIFDSDAPFSKLCCIWICLQWSKHSDFQFSFWHLIKEIDFLPGTLVLWYSVNFLWTSLTNHMKRRNAWRIPNNPRKTEIPSTRAHEIFMKFMENSPELRFKYIWEVTKLEYLKD